MSKRKTKARKLIKLDLSFGSIVPSGFDRLKFDPRKYPWPVKDESVEEVMSMHMLIRVPGRERPEFMDELYRILIPGGKATLLNPYWSSARAIQDFTHEWPPLVDQSFMYFNRKFREASGIAELPEYKMKCDFDVGGGYVFEQETVLKSDDAKPFWSKHYLNAVNDIQIVLTKQ